MIQEIIVGILFILAAGYIINIFRREFNTKKSGCVKGCGTCNAVDFEKIAKEMQSQEKVPD